MYHIGQVVIGYISGIQPYGAFVYIDEETSGLIHISELADNFVKDINQYVEIGDCLHLKVLEVDPSNKQLKLSLKAIYQRPMRRYRMKLKDQELPNGSLGFQTLAKKLPEWVKQWKEEHND